MHTEEMRERMFTMRLSKEESDRLDALAEHYGLNGVGVIRMLLKREARSVGIEPTAEASAKRTKTKATK